MENTIKQFSINCISEVETEESDEYCYAKIKALSTMPNTHRNPISKEVLMKYGDSALGSWIVCDYKNGDATTHSNEGKIVGIVPSDSKVQYVDEEDGNTSLVVDAVISKIYAKEVWDMFKSYNQRNVSCEFLAREGEPLPNGDIPIEAFDIKGITILGMSVNGSCPNASMNIYQFSEDKANQFYREKIENPLKKFADERKSKLDKKEKYVSHPIDTSKESVDMGDWNGDKAKNDLLKEKNYETLGKKVCLDFKGGERKLENCKYPVMNLKNGKWVYNAEGLSSARAYGEQHNPSVADKAITLQKKLGLYKDDKDKEDTKKMSDVKEKEDVVMAKENETKVDDKEKEVEKKEMSAEEEKEMGCDKAMSDEDAKKDDEIEKDKEDIEKAKDDEKADEDDKKEEKSMSEQAKEFAESETDKEYIGKMFSQGLQGVVAEILELKKFQETRLELDKTNKLNSIMASVKGDLDEKQFSELQAEGVTKTFAELDSFENKVKAFAYEASKGKEKQDDGIMKFAGQSNVIKNDVDLDIFDKILRK